MLLACQERRTLRSETEDKSSICTLGLRDTIHGSTYIT